MLKPNVKKTVVAEKKKIKKVKPTDRPITIKKFVIDIKPTVVDDSLLTDAASFVSAECETPIQNRETTDRPSLNNSTLLDESKSHVFKPPMMKPNAMVFSLTASDESTLVEETTTSTTSDLERSKTKKKRETDKYSFDMFETDDSTDDEDESDPKKRPPPPKWSLKRNRKEPIQSQLGVPLNYIDSFFGAAPLVNLKEIFPKIQPKLLSRRESSFVWRTPPRYERVAM